MERLNRAKANQDDDGKGDVTKQKVWNNSCARAL